MRHSASQWLFVICIFAGILLVTEVVDATGCKICDEQSRSKRSIDLNDVLKVPTFRLSGDLRPISYELEIKPDIANGQFEAEVNITARWINDGSTIGLNINDLDIKNLQIRQLGVKDPKHEMIWVQNTVIVHPKSEYHISLGPIMKQNDTCLVQIKYAGAIMTNDTVGFFKKEYMSSTGQRHSFVATQLRAQNARRFFPCLDEPEYKATFALRVIRPRNMTAISNTPTKSIENYSDQNYVIEHFEKTPEISTYQLALMIFDSDFESIAPTIDVDEMEGRKLELKVWGRKEYLDSLVHVPNKIVRIVNYLQKYFNKSIGLPKLDVVAMPMYTASKASDSWGLMFFRESELSSSLIWNTAYELIYQWIGQRVTPFRWSDAQVNKALNSFLASMTTVEIEPDEMEGKWPMTMLYSLYYEFGKTFPFSRVAGIRDEAISAKTELVFRMFNYTMGEESFRRGIQKFIDDKTKQEKPENQEPVSVRSFYAHDVFQCLDDTWRMAPYIAFPDGLTINGIAAPWINRDRVPLVTVIRDYETGNITFTQTVYLRESAPPSNEKMSYQWDIPIVMLALTDTDMEKPNIKMFDGNWMTKSESPIVTLPDIAEKDQFIIVNPEEIGMFPVNYDETNWKMLSEFLQGPHREIIPVLTRAKLVHDSWNLAYGGNLCFKVALNMTLFLKNERSHVVWEPVFTMIDHVGRRIEGSNVYTKFEAYISSLLKPLYAELGETSEPGEPLWKVHMRGLVKNFLCRAGYEPCVTEAREQYKKWMTDDEPDQGNPVANEFICPVFRWGTQEEWEFGLQRVINFPRNTPERKQSERTYLLKTLAGCPKDKSKIERLLNVTILSHYVNFTDSDIHLIYSMLTGGAIGRSTLFNFLKDHWEIVKLRFDSKKHLWNGIVNSATSSFNTREGYDMVNELFEARKGESDDAVLQKALLHIEMETQWNEAHLPVINEWLDCHLKPEDLASIETTLSSTTIAAPVTTGGPKVAECRFLTTRIPIGPTSSNVNPT